MLVLASSLRHHIKKSHEVIPPQTWGVDVGRGGPTTHVVSFPRMPGNYPQRRLDAGIFHVHKFSLKGSGAAGGERAVDPLQHVRNAHDGRADDQESDVGELFQ